ncbi:MAG: ABC transporter permease [Chloroflexota bacterium]|nr:ABC transporter permease [Chloroflexota bacterium]
MVAETLTLRAMVSQRQSAIVVRQLRRNRAAVAGAIILAIEIILAVGAPIFARYDPIEQDFSVALQGPTHAHLFGTDDVGRDLLSRVMYGARISLSVGLIAVGIGSITGVILGVIAGFYGGVIDTLLLRFMDVLLAFPGILLALAVVAVLGPGLYNVMIAVGFGGIPAYTRLARASTLSVRERDYVLAARAIGCPNGRIMGRYILPNVIPPVIVLATLGIAGAIITAAGLSFIGVGAQPPSPEWGAMLSLGRQYLQRAWWVTVFPGLAIMLTVLSVNMVGDAVRDALDPKLRR